MAEVALIVQVAGVFVMAIFYLVAAMTVALVLLGALVGWAASRRRLRRGR